MDLRASYLKWMSGCEPGLYPKKKKKHKTTAPKITSELNVLLNSCFHQQVVRLELHRVNIHGCDAIAKPLVTRNSAKCQFQWCQRRMWRM